jgi:hypothetical protein
MKISQRALSLALSAIVVLGAGGAAFAASANTPAARADVYTAPVAQSVAPPAQNDAAAQAIYDQQVAQAAAEAKAAADAAAAVQAAQQAAAVKAAAPVTSPTLCPAGTKANAVDAQGNESNCEALNSQGQACQAYNDQNVCTNWYKP